jgi:hypothetical protein
MVPAIELSWSYNVKKKRRFGGRLCAAAACMLIPFLTAGCAELRVGIVGAVEAAARSALEGAVQQFFDQFRTDGN